MSAGAAIVVIAAALIPVALLSIVFPEGGSQPFAFSVLWPMLAAGALVASAAPLGGTRTGTRTVTIATLLYLGGCVLAYAISTPVGSNAARLGELVAGPLFALLAFPRRAFPGRAFPRRGYMLLALSFVPLTYIQVHDAISDLRQGWRAPYDSAAYYRPLIRFLDSQPGAREHAWRVEVPFTTGHWEAYRLAPEFPLARGWERQLDVADNPLFYDGRLDAAVYRTWLHSLAVRYVAVSDAPADYSARVELRLVDSGLPYLKRVAALRHWTVYEVTDPTPIVTGAARLTGMGANWLRLSFTRPGTALIKVRFSPYWRLSGVRGCVAPAGQFTRATASDGGPATLTIAFAPGRIGAHSPRCR